ncbi:hypothetical protein SYYSPA8_20095 [Streptomyces yaizuensis]|uniref:Uncharacterized protein n=1 Tax=Streptomyces yaizuensis TaxID=2989713 RepID=A0ABQ5P2G7_9ACTN|nr:hypothetical protein SYYSPA8_20095 [Streptomyces sp. YSPA8]
MAHADIDPTCPPRRRIGAALLAHHRSETQPLLVHGNPVA